MPARDELFEAIFKCWTGETYDRGSQMTKSMRGRINRAAQELRDVDATADEIVMRWKIAARRWPGITITPQTICSHWATLVDQRAVTTVDSWLAKQRS